jgi:hypothetical protein
MYRGTTPTITLKVKTDFDFDYIKEIWFTIASISKKVTKTKSQCYVDNDAKTISTILTQEETLIFSAGNVNVQARILTKDGQAFATPIKHLAMNSILTEGVIDGE